MWLIQYTKSYGEKKPADVLSLNPPCRGKLSPNVTSSTVGECLLTHPGYGQLQSTSALNDYWLVRFTNRFEERHLYPVTSWASCPRILGMGKQASSNLPSIQMRAS